MKNKRIFRWILGLAVLAVVMGMSITANAADNVPYMEGGQQNVLRAICKNGFYIWVLFLCGFCSEYVQLL